MIVAIIQARMGSTRLPGKVLKEIDGTPMLKYMIDRVKKSKLVDKVVVATTNLPEDDAIVSLCQAINVEHYRGHSEDVLTRYLLCARLHKADIIVRLTADCPFIDPDTIDDMIKTFNGCDIDYLANTVPIGKSRWPNGSDIEIFSMDALRQAHGKTVAIDSLKAEQDREHISPIFMEYGFRTMQYKEKLFHDYSKYRFTVDYPEDLETANYIAKELRKRKQIGYGQEIIQILDERPKIKIKDD